MISNSFYAFLCFLTFWEFFMIFYDFMISGNHGQLDMLFSLGCLPLIKYPTQIAATSATLIDHIYSNNVSHKMTAHVLINDISDHMPVMILLNNVKHRATEFNHFVRDTRSFNPDSFLIDLSEAMQDFYFDSQSIHDLFDTFSPSFIVTTTYYVDMLL